IPTTVPVTTPTIDPPVIHDDTSLIPTETPTISPITSTIPPTAPIHTTHLHSFTMIHLTMTHLIHHHQPLMRYHMPIPYGRPYRYHHNGPVHMMTARKRVESLPTHHLVVRHSVDYSSSDYFTSDDSSRDSPSDSSSETPLDSSSNALSDSSSGHSSLDHSSPALPSGMRSSHQLCSSILSIPYSFAAIIERPSHSSFAGPSCKRSRSPTTSVLVSSHVPRALSFVRDDLLPPHKRIRSSDSETDLEDSLNESSKLPARRETSLRDDIVVKVSDEPYLEPDIDLEIQAEINKCIAYVDALRAEGIDVTVLVEIVARGDDILEPVQEEGAIEGTYETLGDLIQRSHDHTVEFLVHQVQVIESI
nr:hypothetical protein [Tanacetum cinerariifolium]